MPFLSSTSRNCRYFVLTAIALAVLPVPADAQRRGQPTETKTGIVLEVQQKGRGRVLVVEFDGKQQNVPVTPKLNLQVIATGDAGFVRPGQFLSATGLMSNNKIFIKNLTIRTTRKGQKLPAGKIVKSAAAPGQSTLAYDVSGLVTGAAPNADYPDHLDVSLKATGANAPIMLEPGFQVTVNSSDPERIPANAPAEFEVAPLRGGQFSVVGVTVQLPDALTAAKFFGDATDDEQDAAEAASPDSAAATAEKQ